MYAVHEVATLTSKGQITLPKSIRDALGVDAGSKIAFDLVGSEIRVSRVVELHEDPAITHFLRLIEQDISSGKNVQQLSDPLTTAMLEASQQSVDWADFSGDVAL